ncbi:hypothetical protein OG205_18025 [Lentzea sp. NBC_00516]|uniref:hypothetical protein n=1 Tax=Lentzea sp. NBC_00516 TaxID=2903582 RepID=UPI002E810991|nr:hypothetical protein [Lentzea sp. NBC_00516]WUD28826.1 hypothetical protein OG205_18025 [Lentzea sp. NBC_00516]
MAFDLPPRRELPADVKERMRPDFAEPAAVRTRRSRAPLAVAAGVTLLIAGGVAVTQSSSHQVGPGHVRVVTPSDQDLARCRTALEDQNWQSTEMAVFGLRKVLHGTDDRFCELTRSRAMVAEQRFKPVALQEGSITYRSNKIIAGVPPKGTTTARRDRVDTPPWVEPALDPEAFNDSVVTPSFFIIEIWGVLDSTPTLFFDDRPEKTPPVSAHSATIKESFESGDPDRKSLVNILAKCTDKAWEETGVHAERLEKWEPVIATGLEEWNGALLARRGDAEFGYCSFYSTTATKPFSIIDDVQEEPDEPYLIAQAPTDVINHGAAILSVGQYTVIGRLGRCTGSVEVSDRDGPAVTAELADGFFLANVPLKDGREDLKKPDDPLDPGRLHVVVRDENNEVAYDGELK